MKKHYIDLLYNFFGKEFEFTVDNHNKYALEFLQQEYGIPQDKLEKLIVDFDLIYLLKENQQYLGILSKVFYEDAYKEFLEEEE